MNHVTSRKAHREWERGGEGKTDDSSLQEEQKDNTIAGNFFSQKGIWQVGFHPETTVCLVSLRNYSDCYDTARRLLKSVFLWLMTWSVGKTRVTGILAVLWILNCSSLIVTQNQMLYQDQLKALTVENWWDIPGKELLYIYPTPLPFFLFFLSVCWGLLSETVWEKGMGNDKWKFLWYWLMELPPCCVFIRHLCLKAPAVLEAYWL